MKLAGQVLGAVGLVTLLVVPFAYFAVGGSWNWLFSVQVVVGIACLAAFFATNVGEVGRIAGGRGTFYVGFTAVSTLAVLAMLAGGNYLASTSGWRRDITRTGLFTLAPDSVETARALDAPVEVLAFYGRETNEWRVLVELVGRYQRHTSQLTLREVDPAREPLLVTRHKVNLAGKRVVLVAGDRAEKIGEISEEAVTNALVRLGRARAKRVYFTTGHGEADLEDTETERGLDLIRIAMDNEGLAAAPLVLGEAVRVPEDAAAVVVAGPRTPLLAAEATLLERYLADGGRLLVMLDPVREAGLDPLLEAWGVQANDDLVLDQNPLGQMMGTGPAVPMVRSYSKHPITEAFDLAVLMPTVRSLTPLRLPGRPRPLPLALSSDSAWGETGYQSPEMAYDDGERRGPMPLAVVATAPTVGGSRSDEARLLVFGDSDFAGRRWATQLGNADLFLNSLNWLAEQVERITIRPRRRTASSLFLTKRQGILLRMLSVNLLPLALAAIGLGVWVVRRSR